MTSDKDAINKLEKLTEVLFLSAFSCYVIFFYLQTTTFIMTVPGAVYSLIRGVLLLTGLIRLYTWRSEINALTGAVLAAFLGLGVFYLVSRGDTMVLDAALVTIGAYRVSFRRIGILYVFIGTLISLLALICSLTGVTVDYTFLTNYGDNERLRHSLGIIYPTDFFAHITYLMLTYFLVRWDRVRYPEIIAAGVILGAAYYFTSARADMVCAAIMLVLMLVCKLRKFGETKVPSGIKKVMLCALMPVCALVTVIVTSLYNPGNALMYKLDFMSSYRLSLGRTGMDLYGFTPLGAPNFAENGNANGGIRNYTYVFYDSAYIKYLFKYGIVLLLVLFLVYALIVLRLSSAKMMYAMVFISVITVSYMIEHHMLELSYNITFLMLTADISTILHSRSYININKRNGIIT